MFLMFQQWLFMKVFDKGKVLENFLSSNEQNCGLVTCEVLVLGFAICFNLKHRYVLNLKLTTQ